MNPQEFKQVYLNITRSKDDAKLFLTSRNPGLKIAEFRDSKDLEIYHDFLLFVLAHPKDQQTYLLAKKSLQHLIKHLSRKENQSLDEIFQETSVSNGIIYSSTLSTFSFTLLDYLYCHYKMHIQFYDIQCSVSKFLRLIKKLQPIDYNDIKEKPFQNSAEILKYLCTAHNSHELEYIIMLFKSSGITLTDVEEAFEELQVYIIFKHDKKSFSRTLLRGMITKPAFIKPRLFKNHFFTNTHLSQVSIKDIKLDLQQKRHLRNISLCTLMMLKRETDPITHGNDMETEMFNMGNGLQIALFYLKPEFRFRLDSYIGYMAFRNSLPYAYGGSWVLGSHAAFGLNLFESFRKSESNWLLTNLCGLYMKQFNLQSISIEPYQIGKDNEDGIKSGAFWFYYKHGFRPLQKSFDRLATEEFKKIQSDRQYRSTTNTLKKLSNSIMIHSKVKNASILLEEKIFHKKYKSFNSKGKIIIHTYTKKLLDRNITFFRDDVERQKFAEQIEYLLLILKKPTTQQQEIELIQIAWEKCYGFENNYITMFQKYSTQ